MHHAALNRARTHNRHLNHQVVIAAWFQARQHRHLGPAFNLENAHCVGGANHVVGGHAVLFYGVQGQRRAAPAIDQIEAAANGREHAQRQHIHLEQAHGVQVVLVPLDDAAVWHGGVLHGYQPCQPALCQHKAAHMLAQVPRKPDQLLGELQPLQHPAVVGWQAGFNQPLGQMLAAVKPEMLASKTRNQIGRHAQGFADIAQRTARAVADDGGRNRGAIASVFGIDVLNDFFAPLVLKVHINVRWLIALTAHETLKQQVAVLGVDRRDAQAITDGRVGCRPPALAQDFLLACKTDDVVHR